MQYYIFQLLDILKNCLQLEEQGWVGGSLQPASSLISTFYQREHRKFQFWLRPHRREFFSCHMFSHGGKHRRNKKYMSPRPPIIHAVLCPKCLLLRFYNNAETRCLSINNRLTLNKQDVQGFSLKYGECMWERG